MTTWLTTHYPKEGIDKNTPWHIYLKDKYKNKAKLIHENDLVFFYELKGPRGTGAGLIVRTARVDGGGTRRNTHGMFDIFQWCIPCRDVRVGRVKPEALDKILGPGFAKLPMIKGGIRALSDTQAERMVREFVAET